ncbi:hypothetical protein [Streptomyces sp. KR55]|uniref:hypothetical protein n=1 Tax=Streptomyces sp. KR55 TaxID=3457425 RepID=UPI003FD530D2
MSEPKTTMAGPAHLPLPAPDAEPATDCDVCQALVAQRAAARRRGDLSRASDCNVEITRHRHEEQA